MPRPCIVLILAALLGACDSGGSHVDGRIRGQELSVKEVVFAEIGDGSEQLILLAANQSNLCGVLTAQVPPPLNYTALLIALEDVDGSGPRPVVPGAYVHTTEPQPPGMFSFTSFFWMNGCQLVGALQPSHGTINVESFGGRVAGSHLVVSLDLAFGDEHMSGSLDATYCPGPRTFGQVCPRWAAPFYPRPAVLRPTGDATAE